LLLTDSRTFIEDHDPNLLALIIMLSPGGAQQTPGAENLKPPQLKLELIPLKKTYDVGETVVVRYRLTSLADGSLCFPPPAIESLQSVVGSLQTEATSPAGHEDLFIENYWERRPHEEHLRANVLERWVRLGMSEPYRPPKSRIAVKLDEPGQWVLRAKYHPPSLSAREKEIVKSMGCTPPDASIQSDPVTITVVNSTK
jgi:hypothetical protein